MGKTGKQRKVYPPEFKRQAVELSKQPGRTLQEAAEGLGVAYKTLLMWRKEAGLKGEQAFPGQGNVVLTAEQRRIKELEKEVQTLRQEREILKRATLFFAKESQ